MTHKEKPSLEHIAQAAADVSRLTRVLTRTNDGTGLETVVNRATTHLGNVAEEYLLLVGGAEIERLLDEANAKRRAERAANSTEEN